MMSASRQPRLNSVGSVSGARAAWLEQHVIPHEPWVRRKLARMGVAPDSVEDVVQDAYLRLLNAESVAQVRDSKSYFSRAAASVVLSKIRRSRCVSEDAFDDSFFARLESPQPGPDVEMHGKSELARVEMTIDQLGSRAREVVILRRVEQLTGRETAGKLGISESAVEKHLSAAMRLLKESHPRSVKRPRQ